MRGRWPARVRSRPPWSSADAALSTAPGNRANVTFEAIEPDAYDAVVAGSPVALGLADRFVGSPTTATAGSKADPIPAIVSTVLPAGSPTLNDGEIFVLGVKGRPVSFRVVGRIDEFPGMATTGAFVVAPLASVMAGWTGNPLSPDGLLRRRSGRARATACALPSRDGSGTIVTARQERYAAMRDAPLTAAVTSGFTIALVIAAAYAGLAIVAVVSCTRNDARARSAFLRTLGLTDRQVGLLTVVEHGLPLLLALVIGVALGLALAWLARARDRPRRLQRARARRSTSQVDWAAIGVVATVDRRRRGRRGPPRARC